jgi:hypothetical protein
LEDGDGLFFDLEDGDKDFEAREGNFVAIEGGFEAKEGEFVDKVGEFEFEAKEGDKVGACRIGGEIVGFTIFSGFKLFEVEEEISKESA